MASHPFALVCEFLLTDNNRAMKTSAFSRCGLRLFGKSTIWLLLFAVAAVPGAFGEVAPADQDFSVISNAVVELFKDQDALKFADALVATPDDWRAVASSNALSNEANLNKAVNKMVEQQSQKVQSSARQLLAKAKSLNLDFSKGDLNLHVVGLNTVGTTHYPALQDENQTLRWAEKIEITLRPDTVTNQTSENFRLAVRGLIKFPSGWHSYSGIQWEEFPSGVVSQQTTQETALLNRVSNFQGFTGEEDPALLKFADVLVRFLRERDASVYEKGVLINSDLVWDEYHRRGIAGGPSREEIDKEVNTHVAEQMKSAQATLKQMEDAGIDLKDADIKVTQASVEHGQAADSSGSLDGMRGQQFKLTLGVKSPGKSKNGTSLSGTYVLAAPALERYGNDWKVVQDIHWSSLPDGILSAEALAAMNQEDYVGEHGTLPPKTAAPDIEFTTLEGERKMKLSDLRGKVVVLDFWATWCGPCQEPMAHLQTLRQDHADWKDKVAIVPLSIDDTMQQVVQHVQKRGWTNTFNVWAGDGGWQATPTKTFRVTGVPTTYIIDKDGKIVQAGHPAAMNIGQIVDGLLTAAK
jgi:thiol-disulfide isomerase/thioredoxin